MSKVVTVLDYFPIFKNYFLGTSTRGMNFSLELCHGGFIALQIYDISDHSQRKMGLDF